MTANPHWPRLSFRPPTTLQNFYRPPVPLSPAKDYEFSRSTMERRWKQGYDNARATLAAAPWKAKPATGEPVRVFDVHATGRR